MPETHQVCTTPGHPATWGWRRTFTLDSKTVRRQRGSMSSASSHERAFGGQITPRRGVGLQRMYAGAPAALLRAHGGLAREEMLQGRQKKRPESASRRIGLASIVLFDEAGEKFLGKVLCILR